MSNTRSGPVTESLSHVASSIAALDHLATLNTGAPVNDAITGALELSDRLIAMVLKHLRRGGFANGSGLPTETLLRYEAKRTGSDARMLELAASILASMPITDAAFGRGALSWSQVRAIVLSAKRCQDAAGRTRVDEVVGRMIKRCNDPEDLLAAVDEEVGDQRQDLVNSADHRAYEGRNLRIQPDLYGGASLRAFGDVVAIATMVSAINAAAERPPATSDDDEQGSVRAQQRFDALERICKESLSWRLGPDDARDQDDDLGGDDEQPQDLPAELAPAGQLAIPTPTRLPLAGQKMLAKARPSVAMSIKIADNTQDGLRATGRLLWQVRGRSPRLSQVAIDMALCDCDVIPILFKGPKPIAVGDKGSTPSAKMRMAIAIRDGRCMGPGCGAPIHWTEAHHIQWGGCSSEENLISLCRRCHRLIHRKGWTVTRREDGVVEWRHKGKGYLSAPRGDPLALIDSA